MVKKKPKPSLQSIAHDLSASYSRHQKADIPVTFKGDNPADRLRPGRHWCECQARVHALVRNCLNCGRVVCAQEGSGPCFFCGKLVCTLEQQKVLAERSKKSERLLTKLMADSAVTSATYTAGPPRLASSALLIAEEFKNKLLIADADTERRTRINDLELDYYDMDKDVYLTKEEKEMIRARKAELQQQREQLKRCMFIDFDLSNATATESSKAVVQQAADDPVIKSILDASRRREIVAAQTPGTQWSFKDYMPRYDEGMSRAQTARSAAERIPDMDEDDDDFYMLSDELQYAAVARKGYAISAPQPYATLIAFGFLKNYPWHEEIDIRGPIIIVAKGRRALQATIDLERTKYRKYRKAASDSREFPSVFPAGAIIGRALLKDCVTYEEWANQLAKKDEERVSQPYMLIFGTFEPLATPIPHLPTSEGLYRLDKQLHSALKRILDPYSLP